MASFDLLAPVPNKEFDALCLWVKAGMIVILGDINPLNMNN